MNFVWSSYAVFIQSSCNLMESACNGNRMQSHMSLHKKSYEAHLRSYESSQTTQNGPIKSESACRCYRVVCVCGNSLCRRGRSYYALLSGREPKMLSNLKFQRFSMLQQRPSDAYITQCTALFIFANLRICGMPGKRSTRLLLG